MKIEELKVGDRIKYKHSTLFNLIYYEGVVGFFTRNGVDIIDNGGKLHYIKNKNIISKLEPLSPQYKEIPIEKENVVDMICCLERDKLEKTMKTCEEAFKKSGWDTSNLIKENPAPKSFKAEIYNLNSFSHYSNLTKAGYFPESHVKLNGETVRITDDSLKVKAGKSYTIEIKEKE